MKVNSRVLIKTIIYIILAVFIVAAAEIALVYKKVYGPNIQTTDGEPYTLYIPSGSAYDDVLELLYANNLVRNRDAFEWVADKKNFKAHVHPGRYIIRHNMSNNALVNILRSGLQEPVQVVFNNARTLQELSEKISVQIEPDADTLLQLLQNEQFIQKYGFNRNSIMGMFIPNTYEIWWSISAEGFLDRMYREYERFWTRERLGKAADMGLTPNQVITMASIIINETTKEDEYSRIAGLYLNRLNKGIKLQADPTVIFAIGDFARQRVLTKDTQVDSPYNTYLYYGLPPGPIAIPSIRSIDAVLDHEKHDYIYFCAKDDFSGYHVFAQTLEQHNRNARLYQRALNQRNILK
ncbi:MAG: endolytic transglycosylase MltG [Bacteroidales bacterium]|nr:endolytic transglycosylase MltG [Bacteroidales bacterium]